MDLLDPVGADDWDLLYFTSVTVSFVPLWPREDTYSEDIVSYARNITEEEQGEETSGGSKASKSGATIDSRVSYCYSTNPSRLQVRRYMSECDVFGAAFGRPVVIH